LETAAGLRILRDHRRVVSAVGRRTPLDQFDDGSVDRGVADHRRGAGPVYRRERRLGFKRILGLAVGLAGVAVLAGPHLAGGSAWPVVEVLLVATCYAIAPLIAARHLGDVPALPMTAACLGFAALVYAAPAAATWPTEMPSTEVLLALAGLAVICTALAFIVFFALIREVGAPRALVFTYVNPAVALAAGVIVLNEPLTALNLAGLALILTGSVLATRRPDEQARDIQSEDCVAR
jgi:drug/metabolite transporter (DMT)-like permease